MSYIQGFSPRHWITGIVCDTDGTTPICGAELNLNGLTATSASDGTYQIKVPANMGGNLSCTKSGFVWSTATISGMFSDKVQNFINAWWSPNGKAANCQLAFKPKGAASLADSYINLANPGTNNAYPGGNAPTLVANGWDFVASSSQWLRTGLYCKATQDQTMIIRTMSQGTENSGILGTQTNNSFYFITNNNYCVFNNGNAVGVGVSLNSTPVTLGMAGKQAYTNGSAAGSPVADRAVVVSEIIIGKGAGVYKTMLVSYCSRYDTTLSASEMSMIHTAMLAGR